MYSPLNSPAAIKRAQENKQGAVSKTGCNYCLCFRVSENANCSLGLISSR